MAHDEVVRADPVDKVAALARRSPGRSKLRSPRGRGSQRRGASCREPTPSSLVGQTRGLPISVARR